MDARARLQPRRQKNTHTHTQAASIKFKFQYFILDFRGLVRRLIVHCNQRARLGYLDNNISMRAGVGAPL